MLNKILNNKFFISIKNFYTVHKKTTIIISLIAIFIIWKIISALTSTVAEVKYVTANVQKGDVIASISGTGQVSSSNQIDLKPKVSGDVTYINVLSGQRVKAGTLIVALNARDASKAVRDAEINLESAKLALEKLKLNNSEEDMTLDLAKAYDDGFTAVSDAFIDLPTAFAGLEDVLATTNISYNKALETSKVALSYRTQADDLNYKAQQAYEKSRNNFRIMDRSSSKVDIENIINETYNTTKLLSDAIKSTKNLVDYMADYNDRPSDYSSSGTLLSGYAATVNGHLSNLLSIKTNIKNYKDAFPSTGLDIQSSELSVRQKENALQDAREKLSDYYIRAPFDGVVAKLDVKKLDSISAGTIVATFITDKNFAQISLNEVDIARVKIGQKATLTFDAVPDLSILGTVAEMDTVGTISSGVVTYEAKIAFDVNDDRIKPGMSSSASIITDEVHDALYVPNSAVKFQKESYYVEVFETPLIPSGAAIGGTPSKVAPIRKVVEIGIANDSFTQIISGLNESEQVVTRIINPSKTSTTSSAPSIFGSPTNGRNGGTVRTTSGTR
jgi:HlyD family secretion protein